MRFLHPDKDETLELSLEDVFIVPSYFEGSSRLDVDLTPVDFPGGSNPIVAANMNAVTGKRMAETMARNGGMGILPQDMELETVERIVRHIHAADPRIGTALEVKPETPVRYIQGIIRKRSHGVVIVVDQDERPLGIITQADLRDRDQYALAKDIMSKQLVQLGPDTSNREAFLLLEENRVRSAPVVNDEGRLVGVLGRDDLVRMEIMKPALDAQGRLLVGAAIGISSTPAKIAHTLVEIGISTLVIDTAHGHQRRMLDVIREVRAAVGRDVNLVAGNVCTAEGARALFEAGADVVKVNVGPGAMCTTRMQTGVGRPSFSSVLHCVREARALGKHVWADGGVRYPRDVALYLAAGASRVMIGSMLAGTYESPGDIKVDSDGKMYKVNYGMASARAVSDRTADDDPFDRARKGIFREGISTSRIYLREGFESVGAVLADIISGVLSAFTYVGARNTEEMHDKAVIGVQTAAGFVEGAPRPRS